jgi:AcrR family transcriptional regulator
VARISLPAREHGEVTAQIVERRNNASGRVTREHIILVAEELFAARGIEGVSLREIGQAAGQRNNAATQYHFGDRAGLVSAILAHRATQNDPMRQVLLDEMGRRGEISLHEVVAALVLPVVDHVAEPGNHYVGFLDRLYNSTSDYGRPISPRPDSPAMDEIATRLRQCLPELPTEAVDRRLPIAVQWMVRTLAAYERAVMGDKEVPPLNELADELIAMLAAAIGAPVIEHADAGAGVRGQAAPAGTPKAPAGRR